MASYKFIHEHEDGNELTVNVTYSGRVKVIVNGISIATFDPKLNLQKTIRTSESSGTTKKTICKRKNKQVSRKILHRHEEDVSGFEPEDSDSIEYNPEDLVDTVLRRKK